MRSTSSSYFMLTFPTTCLKLDTLVSVSQPTTGPPLLPQPSNPLDKYKPLCESTKDSDYSHFKGEGEVRLFLDGGCHGFLSKGFGIMAHPTSDVSARGRGGRRIRERKRESREKEREGGNEGGRARGGEAACCS